MNGVIDNFKGIPIRYCRCGSEPLIFEEGLARRQLAGKDNEIYFTEFYNYSVACDECGEEVCENNIEFAIRKWNEIMEV